MRKRRRYSTQLVNVLLQPSSGWWPEATLAAASKTHQWVSRSCWQSGYTVVHGGARQWAHKEDCVWCCWIGYGSEFLTFSRFFFFNRAREPDRQDFKFEVSQMYFEKLHPSSLKEQK